MINRALTSTFDLPQEQFVRGGGAGRQATGGSAAGQPKYDDAYFGFGDIAEGLQYTDDIAKESEKYYQEREKLKQFARTNWLNNKIDVTAPDPGNPAAVRAAQIFQMGLANLNFQGDKLKESQKAFTRKDTLADQGQYMFEEGAFNQPMAMNTPQQAGYTTMVDPRLKFAADNLGKTFSADQFQKANQNLQGVQQMFANQSDPNSRFSQDTAALAKTITPNKQVFAPSDSKRGSGDSGTLNFVERFVNHKNGGGNWEPSKSYTEGGQVFLESGDYKGTRMGKVTAMVGGKEQDLDAIVEKTVRNPQTGETKFIFTNPSIPPYSLSGSAANQAIESMVSNNAKYPSLTKIQDFLLENNLLQDGVIAEDMLITENTRKKALQNAEKAASTPTRTKEVLEEVGKTASGFGVDVPFVGYVGLPRGSKEYETSFGKVAARKYSNGKYEITSPDGKKQKDLSESDFIRYMRAYGIDIAPSTTQATESVPEGFTPEEWGQLTQEEKDDYLNTK